MSPAVILISTALVMLNAIQQIELKATARLFRLQIVAVKYRFRNDSYCVPTVSCDYLVIISRVSDGMTTEASHFEILHLQLSMWFL